MIAQSVYVSNFNPNYLLNIKKLGINNIFISLHVTEELDKSKDLSDVLYFLVENNFNIIADISPIALTHFSYQKLHDLNINTLRIDYGMSAEQIVDISKEFEIILNASTVTVEELAILKKLGLDFNKVKAMHNFYPQEETGLDLEIFIQRNQKFIDNDIEVIAFISGDEELRGPIYNGLPTLEEHRTLPPYIQYLQLKEYITQIYVGDPQISEEQLSYIIDAQEGVITIPTNCTSDYLSHLLSKTLTIREDSNNILFRIEESRTDFKLTDPIKPYNTVSRSIGDITIANENALRYNGEVMIMRENKDINTNRNVIAKIQDKYKLLTTINLNGKKIKLLKI